MQASVPASVSLALSAPRAASSSRRRSYGRRSYGRSYSRGRSYGRKGGRVGYYQKRAIARKAYIRGRYPSSVYAHPYIARGGAASAALGFTAGKTFAEVSPEEQAARRQAGWYGKGDYMQASGMGDYSLVPSFTGRTMSGTQINLGKNQQMIRQEVFFNVLSPTASQQQIQQFEINLGLDEMFPVGSQFANNYKKYRITQLAFTYKNMLPQSQTTQQVGQVSLTFNPDVGEENEITTNMQVANDQSTVTCNANEDVTLFCEMDPNRGAPNQFLNIRNKALRVTQDPSDFDAGVFILTLAGFPTPASPPAVSANYQIGRVSVSYCVELQHEVVNTSMGNSIDTDYFVRQQLTLGAQSPDQFLDTSLMLKSENNVGCLITRQNSNSTAPAISIQWPQTSFGYYKICLYTESPVSVAVATPTLLSGINPWTISSGPRTVGPVYDMLNVSSGVVGASTFTGGTINQCLAPTGANIQAPGDPYVYANGGQFWDLAPILGVVQIGSVYRTYAEFHVYVPGISSSAAAPTQVVAAGVPTVGASPIQVSLVLSTTGYTGPAVTTPSIVNWSRWTVSVTEYNSTMRLKLNGSSDQPYLTNESGVPTIPNLTTW